MFKNLALHRGTWIRKLRGEDEVCIAKSPAAVFASLLNLRRCIVAAGFFNAKAKRCLIDLFKRHRFAIAKLPVPTAELATSRPRANFSQQSSLLVPYETLKTQRFNLTKRRRVTSTTGFPYQQLVVLDCVVRFDENALVTNLIFLESRYFDCILCMDVLSVYRAVVDCLHGVVRFRPQCGEKWDFYGADSRSKIPLVSVMEMFSVDGARVKCRRFMDQQMREFRVTSCWFRKTVEEVERRRFVKLKRCVLEPAARGFLAIARRCRLKKLIRQRFAFTLKDSADGLCDDLKPADSYSYLESAGTLLKGNQQEMRNYMPSYKKCEFWLQKVVFFGHIISGDGISVDPSKVEAVINWPRPTSVPEIRSFMGLAGYYRQFIKDFSSIIKPITQLTQKNMPYVWTEACEASFLELKKRLTSAPVLTIPSGTGEFVVYCDASCREVVSLLMPLDN
ncbi:DNA/RNA polymerase superfamily protein [Dorcoceras hygrometricum]|uniref:DNA/RNA polymerase superfamily protein n=1 Tax=Dorcoceras hygrometricum TaxID=472368 RepID=A0A2Z7B3R9_9LAMI|nr:DNA/RNA polymerase superfamily protein [Dorcoceras hygrometricum]